MKYNIRYIIYYSLSFIFMTFAFCFNYIGYKYLFSFASLLTHPFVIHTLNNCIKCYLCKENIKNKRYEFVHMNPYERNQLTNQLKDFLNKKETE
jgi:hypothetical protein